MNLKQKINNFILDTLFPISCLSCQAPDVWLCPECFKKIETLSFQVCPYCEKEITNQGKICPHCRDSFLSRNKTIPLDALIIATKYSDKIVSKLIHLYKYNFIEDLSAPIGKIISAAFLKHNLPLPDFIVPVPLHKRRLRWRGFNQSELLAKSLAENILPNLEIEIFADLIKRHRYTPPQMKVKQYSQRKQNLKNAFSQNIENICPSKIKGRHILLVDDIATTGSTLFECAKILRQLGAKKITGIVVARQEVNV